ncbi:MAG: class I SAM-dependent methyltransferase [archaeon]|nr:class I SAM-dependent methyltransferase [archaeon]
MPHRNNLLRKIEVNFRVINNKNKEKNILKTICIGKGADIGCGSDKISENCIGIDLTGKGEEGKFGSQKGKFSQADFKSEGDNLKMFKNNKLDFIVAKHNLEHYENPEKTLNEWKRVLKKGGKIGVIVPDDKYLNTKTLDPTHKCEFNLDSLEELFKKVGFKIVDKGAALKHWSIYIIAEK